MFYDVKAKKTSPTCRNNRVLEEGISKRVDRDLMANDFISKDARYRSWTRNGGFSGHFFWIEGNNTNPP